MSHDLSFVWSLLIPWERPMVEDLRSENEGSGRWLGVFVGRQGGETKEGGHLLSS